MIRKLLLLSLILFSGITTRADNEALNLEMKDGTVHSFLLSNEPTITLGDDLLVVTTSDGTTASYDLYEVSKYTFGSSTGISSVFTSGDVERDGDCIIFHGITDGKVTVTSLSGIAANVEVSSGSDGTVVSLSSLPSGIYIVKVNNVVIKISKK